MKTITIVGGGLAGLTLGIGLRQRGIPVVIHEAGTYPRHRVCGEFISGRGQDVLNRLELAKPVVAAGSRVARTVAFFTAGRGCSAVPLPEPALCVSRYSLDAILAERFCKMGGTLLCERRWRSGHYAEGVVLASGRRLNVIKDGWRWFGLKAHASGVHLSTDLEMHLVPNGYVGLSSLPDGVVNVCGIFRTRLHETRESQPTVTGRLRGRAGSLLHEKLQTAVWQEDSICAVGGLSVQWRGSVHGSECRIGDAWTMIAPITGNGMSLAFESAELAIAPVASYAHGQNPWAETAQTVARTCEKVFGRRLTWGGWLHGGLFLPLIRTVLFPSVGRWNWLWNFSFKATR